MQAISVLWLRQWKAYVQFQRRPRWINLAHAMIRATWQRSYCWIVESRWNARISKLYQLLVVVVGHVVSLSILIFKAGATQNVVAIFSTCSEVIASKLTRIPHQTVWFPWRLVYTMAVIQIANEAGCQTGSTKKNESRILDGRFWSTKSKGMEVDLTRQDQANVGCQGLHRVTTHEQNGTTT